MTRRNENEKVVAGRDLGPLFYVRERDSPALSMAEQVGEKFQNVFYEDWLSLEERIYQIFLK